MQESEVKLFLSETLAGRYRPLRHIGSGGFAGVFEAKDGHTGRSVAAKILRLSQCSVSGSQREFRDEVELLGKLRGCDRVIQLHDSGEHTVNLSHPLSGESISVSTEFAVLELAAGSLADLLLYGDEFSWPDRLRLYRDVIKGVHQMHLHRIVHRDVKAENGLVFEGRSPVAKVGDLGRSHDTSEPRRFAIEAYLCGRGDTRFAPFEFLWLQGTQEPEDQARADLFLLGALLFEIAVGVSYTALVTASPVTVIHEKAALSESDRERDWRANVPLLRGREARARDARGSAPPVDSGAHSRPGGPADRSRSRPSSARRAARGRRATERLEPGLAARACGRAAARGRSGAAEALHSRTSPSPPRPAAVAGAMTTMLASSPPLAGARHAEALSPSRPVVAVPEAILDGPPTPGYLLRGRRAAAAHSHSALAQARLAQAAQAAGLREEALEAARDALELGLDQGAHGAAYAAMVVLAAGGREAELAKLLDDRRGANLPVSLRLYAAIAAEQHGAAIGLFSDASSHGERSPSVLAMLVWLHVARGENDRAIAVGRRAQALGVDDFSLYANLGYAHAALGNLEKAVKLTRQAAALAPMHRGVAHNLARFLTLAGRPQESVGVLERLREDSRPLDVALALSLADAVANLDRPEQARKLLQGVRASTEWAVADAIPRAQLDANLAILRYKTGKADADTTRKALLNALSRSDYRSLSIAFLLTNLTLRSDQADLLAGVIERLRDRHDAPRLHPLQMLLAVLRHEAAPAIEHVLAWVEREPLNPNAAARAVELVADLRGDYAAAAQIGLRALAHAPHDRALVNNAAYALALGGEPSAAKRVLRRLKADDSDPVELIATRALVELALGHTDRGVAGYRRAREVALARGDDTLADLVALSQALSQRRLMADDPPVEVNQELLERVERAASSRPLAWIASRRAERELAGQNGAFRQLDRS